MSTAQETTGAWRKLERSELRGFNNEATDLILAAMRLGGEGRFSSNHHVIIRAPEGDGTIAVSSKLTRNNRSLQNVTAQFRRLFPDADRRLAELDARPVHTNGVLVTPAFGRGQPDLSCPVKDCGFTTTIPGALYSHKEKNHRVCGEPGCGYASDSHQAMTLHTYRVHRPITLVCEVCKKEFQAGSGAAKWCKDPACRREGKRRSQNAYRAQQRRHKALVEGGRKGGLASQAKKRATVEQPQREPAPVISLDVRGSNLTAEQMVAAIREVLGQDDRVTELEAEVERLSKANADLQAKLDLLKEALGA